MKLLIAGVGGQLGFELARSLPLELGVIGADQDRLDITDAEAVRALIHHERPEAVINAAAYTAVDKAESEPERAFAVNAAGAENLARACADVGAYFVQISTDFVFAGDSARPYRADDTPAPLGVYGASKAEGERRVREVLGERALILRTAWVYSVHGHNFVKTMLRLMGERDTLNVVSDQIGTPTSAAGLARAIGRAVELGLGGTHHWTDAGVASWYDFACAIEALGRDKGLLEKACAVHPIRTEDYLTPAKRPACAVLDKTATWRALDLQALHWRAALANMLDELARAAPTE